MTTTSLAARLRELKEANDKAESEQFEYDEGGYDDAYVHAYHTKQELDDFIHDNLPAILDAMERGEMAEKHLRDCLDSLDDGVPVFVHAHAHGLVYRGRAVDALAIRAWLDKAALAPRAGGE